VLYPVTAEYDVPLMVARGYASLSFLSEAAAYMRQLGKRVVILHLGDHDPSGRDAGDKIEATLRDLVPELQIDFDRVAVTERQIAEWSLPSRPTKAHDPRAKGWTGGDSVELDAIPAPWLRRLLEGWIEALIPDGWLAAQHAAEASERDLLDHWTGLLTRHLE
jgi:hypothetical protein